MFRSAPSRFSLFVLLSYGLFYFSYKYYVPDLGGNDFYAYYLMYLDPFNYDVAKSSFVYRQLTALLVHLVWKLGIFYDTTIAFSKEGYDKRVFFAAIFTNYIALTIVAIVVTYTTEKLCIQKDEALSILSGLFCFFGFFVQQAILTGLTEGISWLLVAVGFLGYVRKSLIPICGVLSLSVIQRETIPFVFGTFAAVGLLFRPNERRFDAIVLFLSLSSFLGYVLMRSVFIPVPGHEEQLNLSAYLLSLAAWREKVTEAFIFQAFLSQNLLILLAAVLAALTISRGFQRKAKLPLFPTLEISLFASVFVLSVIGFAAGIQVNNIGRILSVLTPVAAALLARNLSCLLGKAP
jgi:hypothetical protein